MISLFLWQPVQFLSKNSLSFNKALYRRDGSHRCDNKNRERHKTEDSGCKAMGKAIVYSSVGCEGINVSYDKDILVADNPEGFPNKTIELLKNPYMRINF